MPPAWGVYPAKATTKAAAPITVWPLPFIEQEAIYNQFTTATASGTVAAFYTTYAKSSPTVIRPYQCPSDTTLKLASTQATPGTFTSYGANAAVFGNCQPNTPTAGIFTIALGGGTKLPTDIPDGTSNTILWMDKLAYCTAPTTPPGGTVWAENGLVNGTNYLAIVPPAGSHINPYGGPPGPLPIYSPGSPQPQVAGISNSSACIYGLPSSGHSGVLQVGMADGSVKTVDQAISPLTFSIALIPNDKLPMGPDW